MDILLVHLGTPCECFVASSIIKGIIKEYGKNITIHLIVNNKFSEQIYRYNKYIKKTYVIDKVPNEIIHKDFDLFINLHPDFTFEKFFEIKSKLKFGFGFSQEGEKLQEILYGDKKSNKNIFQIYYNLANMKWSGESYNFEYYPKSKTNKRMTGIGVANINLKNYIIDRLQLNLSETKTIPFKQNIFKKMDEINRFLNIVTDDFFTMNVSIHLRKNVFFLETLPYNFQLEFFGSGKVFRIPKEIVR